ncbi:PhnD/SsuA/transferrin family substrate-binding protein [Cognatishimia sp. F0-27]|uniref:PhnD/SsuA/transferrin family substrate-binding protein n=1 Tax=Cognatishimia sp. F0-27 TaxID=2816855 RepID=UPI001D0CADF7|nr:PhnD/SsuA/transferrin family substrate-binding protein [Cognatishimia sp. F0-27]MCC1492272.1 PhnD/SsuA/transferrin family substrate-binding protein [Cognatishimia sp. F0-27]
MIASLPMYWNAGTATRWRAFWSEVQSCAARDGLALPDLTPPEDLPRDWRAHWRSPDLALSMTCGLPFRTALKGEVTYVGTLGFGLDCAPGHYYSRVIMNRATWKARRDKTARPTLTLAYNAADSQSGWAVSQHATPFSAPLRFTGYLHTGAHAASLAAVAEGRADIAYIDAVTWQLLKRSDPRSREIQLAGRSVTTPALPLITARHTDPEPLRRALRDAVLRFEPDDPYAMGGPLSFTVLDPEDYHAVPVPAPPPAAEPS